VEESTVRLIHDRHVAERGAFLDDETHGFADLIVGPRFVEKTIGLQGRDDPVRDLIDHDINDRKLTDPDVERLLPKREEEIFREAPVEEGSDVGIHGSDLEGCKLSDFDNGLLHGRNDAVLGVATHEYFDFVTLFNALRHFSIGEENLPQFTAVEIESEIGIADDEKGVRFAELGHPPS
jgi:hypothetical protein